MLKNMNKFLRSSILLVVTLVQPAFGQIDHSILRLLGNPFSKIESIECKSVTNVKTTDLYYVVMPKVKRTEGVTDFLWYCSDGRFYAYDQQRRYANGKNFFQDVRAAYNGEFYQQLVRQSQGLYVSKKQSICGLNTMFNPLVAGYRFLFLLGPNQGDPYIDREIFDFRDVKAPEVWARVQSQCKVLRTEERSGYHCTVIEVPGGFDETTRMACKYRVWLARELAGFPVKWEEYSNEKDLISSYEVSEVGTIRDERGSISLPFPKKAMSAWYSEKDPKGVLVVKDYEISSIKINHKVEETIFTIDPGLATYVKDVDLDRNIVFKPKLKQ